MWALVYHGPNDLRYEQITKPVPGAGEVLVAVKAVGVCGSDVHGYQGITGRRIPPMVMGHEFAGQVAEVGPNVEDVEIGMKVAVQPLVFCGKCGECRRGNTNLCVEGRLLGVLTTNGAMAEYVVVPAKQLFPLPEGLGFAEGALVEPAAVALRAINKLGDRPMPDRVAIVGAGPIGLLLLQYVKLRGAKEVLVTDLENYRLELAKELGADMVLNPKETDVILRAQDWTHGEGVPLAIEAVGATPTVQQAMAMVGVRGTVLWVGNSAKFIEMNMQQTVTREYTILGTFIYSHEEFGQALKDIGAGRVKVKPLLSRSYPLSRGPEVFATLAEGKEKVIKAVLTI
ncbi:MAG: galactitol-1-phosphate 5-dehydrogenase [Firmicutes bacterium]|nr:galactitol-1-phosphate 5-dehydrogenase [Bacillota bacterium]